MELCEEGVEIGDIGFYAVDAERIGSLISGAQESQLIDVESGGFL